MPRISASSRLACAEQAWIDAQLAQPIVAPAWRVWAYDEPAIVLGCSQRRLLAEANPTRDLEVLLRRSGGGAVLTGPWMLGISVALPSQHAWATGGPVASYRGLGEMLAALLRDQAGLEAVALQPDSVGRSAPNDPLAWACFGGLSPWEVVVDGRKIAGLAQVRGRHGVLLVGGLLLTEPDWSLLCTALQRPLADADALTHRTTSWAAQGGHATTRDAIAARLLQRLRHALAPEPAARTEPVLEPIPEPA